MTRGLSSRWSARLRHRQSTPSMGSHRATQDLSGPPCSDSGTSPPLGAPLPTPLGRPEIARLFHGHDAHELEHLLADAVRHTATLKQLRDRKAELMHQASSRQHHPPTFDLEGESEADSTVHAGLGEFFYAFELWRTRLRTLEMIAAARSSLRTLKEPEETAVQRARFTLRDPSTI